MYQEFQNGQYRISTDQRQFDLDKVHSLLVTAYWCEGVPKEVVERAIKNSLSFGVFVGDEQVGIARVITDRATFAYLADVFIHEEHRGKGLGTWLVECIMTHPDLQGLRRWSLATRDAHELYRKFGFSAPKNPEKLMEITRPNMYKEQKSEGN